MAGDESQTVEGTATSGPVRRALLTAALAFGLTLASLVVPGRVTMTYGEIMGCEQGCDVVAAGFPFAFVVDYPGISVVGSVSWSGALLGEDKLLPGRLAASFAFWLAVGVVLVRASERLRARRWDRSASTES